MMCYYIEIEDIAANAMIEVLESRKLKQKEVSFGKLHSYGKKVAEILNEQHYGAVLINSRNATNRFEYKYKEVFIIRDSDNGKFLSVGKGITADNLREIFRARLSIDAICAFSDDQSIKVLED